ncbi:MAG: hypothetical protein KDA91_18505 [Planctomycetaceae bacterium]|nr:hypothetical protein [Planctomycetaceae bacterium]MCA9152604.1 hypothetical protein [Planctomycetales bacterium]
MEQARETPVQPTGRQWPSPFTPTPAPPVLPPPQIVTQDELQRLQVLLHQRREAERLRKSILERLADGAATEDGRLTARIRQSSCRRISRSALVRLWGEEYVESLRRQIPETPQAHLVIEDQSCIADL